MAASKISHLAQVITCHAFNKDKSMVAICPNDSSIVIFKRQADGTFNREDPVWVMDEHDQVVTGIDWAPNTNRIVTCSQDRNAYVWQWNPEGDTWKPTLVILRINRAATSVKWSPNEDKFAVSSGAKSVSVCYFEEDNNWWVSKHIRKGIKSTVLSVDWHPNNVLLALGGTESVCRVASGWVKNIDQRPGQTPFGARLPFAELLGEYASDGWVECVRWSPSGNQLAFVSHDSSITFIDVSQGAPGYIQNYQYQDLPFCALVWLNETNVVAVGHSSKPILFSHNGTQWAISRELDQAVKAAAGGAQKATSAAFSMFQNKVTVGQDTKSTEVATLHQNAITDVSLIDPKHIATTGLDGRLIVWGPI